jgi:spermidine synthase
VRDKLFLPAAFVVFTASGFAGLIYESTWSHYLKLFLGHAAHAQTLVLVIFMGGMALGAWLASRLTPRWTDLLLAYALIEALIGVGSLVFHDVFVAATAAAFDAIIPALGSPGAIHAFKWMLGAALILPQSLLLGMTFPLMTGGVLRVRPQRAGYVVAMLYFTNSLGAAIGVLVSGFYLIGWVGLPGALTGAAVINLAVAAAVMFLKPLARPGLPVPAPAARSIPAAPVAQYRLLLVVAALTGASSFIYEIGWIRMLSLVLGSSTHAFELMLSAFILGIAGGGLAIRRRIDAAADTVSLLGWVQVVMGVAALATLPLYGASFHWMQAVMQALSPTEGGYLVFNLASHGICLAVMFPAAFCAGMTLPLITASLLRNGAGERAVGQVYAANTAGAIAGVVLAVHVGFALLGLKGLIMAGAMIDLALGVALLASMRRAGARPRGRMATATALLVSLAALFAAGDVHLDARLMSSGVFRVGQLLDEKGAEQVKVQLDGKTATVSVTGTDKFLALRTNGKSDGAIAISGPLATNDEAMMILAGALPQFLAPSARQVANIGLGTGMTTHVLLSSRTIESVDTVEIEPAMAQAAQRFRPFTERTFDDPRSHIHFDDAKTFFSARQARYDVIVSEPSNPWVSGVSGLFSTEFYRELRRHLRDGGLFVQWIHVYEMTPALVSTITAALDENFADYELWMPSDGDLLVIAAHRGKVPAPDARAFDNPLLRAELARINIRNLDDLLMHRVAGRAAIGPYFEAFGVQPNSDYLPLLDVNAPLARFLRGQVDDVPRLLRVGIPLFEFFDRPRRARPDPTRLSPGVRPWLRRADEARDAAAAAAFLRTGARHELAAVPPILGDALLLVRGAVVECRLALPSPALQRSLGDVAWAINAHLAPRERNALWREIGASPCVARLSPLERDWVRLHQAVAAEDARNMVAVSRRVLDSPQVLRELQPYALAAHMSGLILAGQGNAAMSAFVAYRRKIRLPPGWQPVFRFLVGQTLGVHAPPPG